MPLSGTVRLQRIAAVMAGSLAGWVACRVPATAATVTPGAVAPGAAAAGPEMMRLLEWFGGPTGALVLAAVVVLSLLIWRVAVMVMRERPTPGPQRRPVQRESVGPGDRSPLTARTDWGFDQNKRAALSRSAVDVGALSVGLPSMEHAVTQWSASDVQKALDVEVMPVDALGKPPTSVASLYQTSFNPYFDREQPTHIEVVEVADALLQAELLVQLGDPKQAMTLLSNHIRETENPGPSAWLMLLNLYQSTGREAQYNALGAGFRILFNAEVPPWATSSDVTARDLESYGLVMAKIQTTWSGPQMRGVLEGLLRDDRGGSRQGFSLNAYRDLVFLVEILDALDAIAQDAADRQGIQRKLSSLPG